MRLDISHLRNKNPLRNRIRDFIPYLYIKTSMNSIQSCILYANVLQKIISEPFYITYPHT